MSVDGITAFGPSCLNYFWAVDSVGIAVGNQDTILNVGLCNSLQAA